MKKSNTAVRKTGIGLVLAVALISLAAPAAPRREVRSRPSDRGARRRPKRRRRRDVRLKIGQVAPDFELYKLNYALANADAIAAKRARRPARRPSTQPAGKVAPGKIRLSSFRGKRPAYVIFASYT